MKILIICTGLLVGCGTRVSGKTKHEVTGEVTVKVILEVPACDALEDEYQRAECNEAFIEALAKDQKKKNK